MATSNVISMIYRPSATGLPLMDWMLMLSPESVAEICESVPGRLSPSIWSYALNALLVLIAHSTSIMRSSSVLRLEALGQSARWTETPLPRVI